MTKPLIDAHGRRLHYLRLSVTDRCNFRCLYCSPEGCPGDQAGTLLSIDEINRLTRAFARLGFGKIRLTGGEPTIRSDILHVVSEISASGLSVGMTTNGLRLEELAPRLKAAGLTSLNVSLDSLDPDRFRAVAGLSDPTVLPRIVAGVEAAIAAGIPRVKVNVVLLRDMSDAEFDGFLEWAAPRPLALRFIELMPTTDNRAFFERNHRPAAELLRKLEQRGWVKQDKSDTDGPAVTYGYPGAQGRVGFVAPYNENFCDSCNRLRVSSRGELRLCLFGEDVFPLRDWLRSDDQLDALVARIEAAVRQKPATHLLSQGHCGRAKTLAVTGG
jgi:cyclic pyranopterin phosphate synthase